MYLGNINEDLTFEYGDGTDVHYGCAATLKNEFWYLGGYNYKRQVKWQKYLWDILKSGASQYFADCELKTPDKRYSYESKEAEKLAEKLWKISEEITQSKFN